MKAPTPTPRPQASPGAGPRRGKSAIQRVQRRVEALQPAVLDHSEELTKPAAPETSSGMKGAADALSAQDLFTISGTSSNAPLLSGTHFANARTTCWSTSEPGCRRFWTSSMKRCWARAASSGRSTKHCCASPKSTRIAGTTASILKNRRSLLSIRAPAIHTE